MDAVQSGMSVLCCKGLSVRVLGPLLMMFLATSAVGQTPETGSPLADMPEFGAAVETLTHSESPQNKGQGGITCQILPNPQGHYTAFVFDSVRGVLAVYMVDQGTGQINLKSVRQVSWDLRLEEFNTNKPLPSDLRDSQR